MSTDLIDYLSVIRKLNEKYSAMIPDKDYWNGRSVGEFFSLYRDEVTSMIKEYPLIEFDGARLFAGLVEDDLPFVKEVIQAKLYSLLLGKDVILLPRYSNRVFHSIFSVKLKKGSIGDGFAALADGGEYIEFKLCADKKLPQRITAASKAADSFFICVFSIEDETIRKIRSGRLKITIEEGKYGYIFDISKRKLYRLEKNKKVTLDLLDLLPAMSWGGRTDNVTLPTADIVYSERISGVNENNKEAGNGLHDLLPAMSWGGRTDNIVLSTAAAVYADSLIAVNWTLVIDFHEYLDNESMKYRVPMLLICHDSLRKDEAMEWARKLSMRNIRVNILEDSGISSLDASSITAALVFGDGKAADKFAEEKGIQCFHIDVNSAFEDVCFPTVACQIP